MSLCMGRRLKASDVVWCYSFRVKLYGDTLCIVTISAAVCAVAYAVIPVYVNLLVNCIFRS